MPSIDNPAFLEAQVQKLMNFKNGNTAASVAEPPKKEEIPSNLGDAINDLSNKAQNSTTEVVNNNTQPIKDEKNKEGGEGENKVEIPQNTQERVNLDKNKEQKTAEIDSDTKSHLEWLKEEEEVKEDPKKPEDKSKDYEAEISSYKSKIREYEDSFNDEYVKAIVEFRKSGGTDLNELNAKLGIVDTNKVTIEDFYKAKAESQGLKGEDLIEAVEEAIEKYRTLPKIDQAEILNNFKDNLKKNTEEKLKSFSVNAQMQRSTQEKLQTSAMTEMKTQVGELVGKKWRGLLIDEKMSKEILQSAPDYSLPIVENGKVVGYDTKHGVEMAIYAKFNKKLLKAQYDLAKSSAYDKLIEERNRPSENMTSNQIVVTAPNDIKKITEEMRAERERRRNKGN